MSGDFVKVPKSMIEDVIKQIDHIIEKLPKE